MKHAYMIMAHNQVDLLKLLLEKLDIEDNDIIVHLDQKCNLCESQLDDCLSRAKLYFTENVSVTWGAIVKLKQSYIY